MNAEAQHTPYHPKWYRRQMSVLWWVSYRNYSLFMVREVTCIFVAFFALITLWQVHALAEGREAYDHFLARLKSPRFVFLDILALIFVLFHSITWFNATPKAIRVFRGEKRMPDALIAGLNYVVWLILSVLVGWFLMRG